jgi:hypothetical protein
VRALRLALLPLFLVLLTAGPASAQAVVSVDQIAAELSDDGVAVDPSADVPLDEARVRDAVAAADAPVYVAVVTAETAEREGGAAALVTSLGRTLGDSTASILVISDQPFFYAESGRAATQRGIDAGGAIEAALASGSGGAFSEAAVTSVVVDFVDRVDAQASGRGGSGTSGSGGGSSALGWLLPLGLLGGGAYLFSKARRGRADKAASAQSNEDARADVESLYGRLGSDVQLLSPGDDKVAQQALADAAERYNATGALMSKADTPGEWAAARRTAVEGITAARVVRERLGLDPGPEVPVAAGSAPQLTEEARVRVGDDEYDGSPRYTPGRAHYYEGGYYGGQVVPGGWYATPFWQSIVLSSVLGGGMRRRSYGGYYGGGYGGGFGGGLGGGFGGGLGGGRRRSYGGPQLRRWLVVRSRRWRRLGRRRRRSPWRRRRLVIFFTRSGGSGIGFLLFFFLLFVLMSSGNGGGGLFLLLFFGMFFLLPILFFRSMTRGATRVLGGGHAPQGYEPQGYAPPQPSQQPQPVDPADVQSLLDRLGHDVRTLDVGEDNVSRQAMADASGAVQHRRVAARARAVAGPAAHRLAGGGRGAARHAPGSGAARSGPGSGAGAASRHRTAAAAALAGDGRRARARRLADLRARLLALVPRWPVRRPVRPRRLVRRAVLARQHGAERAVRLRARQPDDRRPVRWRSLRRRLRRQRLGWRRWR